MGGDVAQLVERRTGTLLTQVRFAGVARDFSPKVDLAVLPPQNWTSFNVSLTSSKLDILQRESCLVKTGQPSV